MPTLLGRDVQFAPDVVADVVLSTYTSAYAVTALGVIILYDIRGFPPELA